jgi:ubiquinone/menaquinone biosynthesis C-methylase UbiE
VRQWVAENEARLDERRRQFDLLGDFIPHPAGAPLSILDVGAGWGPVTRHLLARFPNARAVLLDYSDLMFAEARPRLAAYGARVRYVLGDLSRPGALAAAVEANGGPFDAIVSSSCLHNIRPTERIPALYRELRAATARGGCFLNLDMVGSASPELQAVWHRARVEQHRRRRLAETGVLPSYEEAEAEVRSQRRRHGGAAPAAPGASPDPTGEVGGDATPVQGASGPATFATSGAMSRSLYDHLTWLHEAGFDVVECFWREGNRALIGGYVLPLREA